MAAQIQAQRLGKSNYNASFQHANGSLWVEAAEVAGRTKFLTALARHQGNIARETGVTARLAGLVLHFLVLPAVRTDAVTILPALEAAYFAKPNLAVEAVLDEDGGDGDGGFVALYAFAEALSNHFLVLNADLLLAGLALVVLGFVPGAIVGYDGVRLAFWADEQVLPALDLLALQKLLDEAAGDEGDVLLGAEHALEAVVVVAPEYCAELGDLLAAVSTRYLVWEEDGVLYS